jgi:hypothetical protein
MTLINTDRQKVGKARTYHGLTRTNADQDGLPKLPVLPKSPKVRTPILDAQESVSTKLPDQNAEVIA